MTITEIWYTSRIQLALVVFISLANSEEITLTDLPDEVCFGGTYQIYCTHPVLDVSSGYLSTVLWTRNRIELIPDGTTEQSVPINSTVTGLQINITKGVHEPGTYYMCLVLKHFNATFFSTLESNDVTVNSTSKS